MPRRSIAVSSWVTKERTYRHAHRRQEGAAELMGPWLATPELERVASQFVSDAVDAVMAEDSIFGRLRRLELPEGVTGVSVEVDQSALDSPSVALQHLNQVTTQDLIEGNLEELHRILIEMADAFLSQYMPRFFDHLGDAVDSVGNTMALEGKPLSNDDILEAFERVEWAADEHGIVRPPQIHAAPGVAAKLDALPELTDVQQARWIAMYERKQEEHVSRRRSRRLRHKPDGA